MPPLPTPPTRRAFLGLGAAAVTASALVACSPPDLSPVALPDVGEGYDGPPLTLKFWNGLTGGDGAIMRELLLQFRDEHPNITIEMFAMPWPSFYQKFPSAVVSGLAPDIGLMHNFHVATNAARGVIVPLDEAADRIGLSEANFSETVWRSGIVNGRRYSIPLDVWPDSLFYNRRVLENAGLDPDDPPRDRASYEETLEILAEQGIAGHWLPAIDPQGVGRGFDSLQWQFGGELYDEEGTRALFNGPEGREALEWQLERILSDQSKRNVSGGDANVAFKNDLNAFLWGGPGALINDLGSVEDLDWGVVPLPLIGEQPASFSGSHQFVIMRQRAFDPDRMRAAFTFLSWISENSIAWAGAGPIPARRDVVESPEFAELPAQSSIAEALPDVRFYPLIPGIFDVQSTILYPALSDVLLLNADPQEALDGAAEQANHLLEENRQKYAEAMS
ncbi:extracellular solute-binding protein family 1 [Beutenbergia cavernae DSM 12333]|uniref:Extracellular solute-binding protein family 1 n=1 Tax=Beutenbergia cavernae (strain ATCC BAA-8 / DSM 12333 / CCUG 43141 / JCM 11478 / NBRC 16432 / NCIMB 13614 / HKI 0122) TaxID=471853 RepID=C5BY16_BEUC1|nr:ABC transporter substrate-binding protein [Beutenbergia cavernae]ACQ78910.1 extracellular solute-binding protein family 1 [Beutenbergia cavernae DSM 12333]